MNYYKIISGIIHGVDITKSPPKKLYNIQSPLWKGIKLVLLTPGKHLSCPVFIATAKMRTLSKGMKQKEYIHVYKNTENKNRRGCKGSHIEKMAIGKVSK